MRFITSLLSKSIFLNILFLLTCSASHSQSEWEINFEDPAVFDKITIDTIANQNNIWQIGIPSKPDFNLAHSGIYALMTDTLNPYPVNDTSSFIVEHFRAGGPGTSGNLELTLQFWYKLQCDSLTDFGKVEVSFDNKASWIDLLTADTLNGVYWIDPKPALTGNSAEWQHFALNFTYLSTLLAGYYDDTLFYRFTFISDSIQTNKEGWMIDDFKFTDYWENVNEQHPDKIVKIFPNPVNDVLIVDKSCNCNTQSVQITSLEGKPVFTNPNYQDTPISTLQLKRGSYLLVLYCDEHRFTSKLTIIH